MFVFSPSRPQEVWKALLVQVIPGRDAVVVWKVLRTCIFLLGRVSFCKFY